MEVKWIKIVTDIFDDEKILLIEQLPDGYAIIVVWFKLLCLAGKQNNSGVFFFRDKMPFTDDMLSAVFRMKKATVQMALEIFKQYGMIEIVDNVITIPNWGKYQSVQKLDGRKDYMRKYMTEYRLKQQKLITGDNESGQKDEKTPVNDESVNKKVYNGVNSKPNSKPNGKLTSDEDNKELYKEEKELYKEENDYVDTTVSMSVGTDDAVPRKLVKSDYDNILDYWNSASMLKEIKAITPKRQGHINARYKEYGLKAIYEVITNCGKSPFLRGHNDRGWQATFDWAFLPNKFVKILEGNYLPGGNKNGDGGMSKMEQKYQETLQEMERLGL